MEATNNTYKVLTRGNSPASPNSTQRLPFRNTFRQAPKNDDTNPLIAIQIIFHISWKLYRISNAICIQLKLSVYMCNYISRENWHFTVFKLVMLYTMTLPWKYASIYMYHMKEELRRSAKEVSSSKQCPYPYLEKKGKTGLSLEPHY